MKRKDRSKLLDEATQAPTDPADTSISALSLRRRYGPHYEELLSEHLEELDAQGRQQFKIVKPLPSKAEYETMQRTRFTKPCEDWIQEAFDRFEQLKNEYQEWLDNMPDSLQQGSKAGELQDAIDGLAEIEGANRPSEDWLEWLPVFHLPAIGAASRPAILGQAASILRNCANELRRLVKSGDHKALKPPWVDEDDSEGCLDEALDPAKMTSAADDLDSIADEADAISLPGMF